MSSVAWSQEALPCALEVPNTLTENDEVRAQVTCQCRITAFEATVYDRWANAVWSGNKVDGFPAELLSAKDVKAGTYLWKVKYTAIATGMPRALEATGYVNVIK